MGEKNREQLLKEIAETKRKMGEGLSDMEKALHWVKEMKYPCSDPQNPKVLNLGEDWYLLAKTVLEEMKNKPEEDQNKYAIEMLEDGIREYEEKSEIN